MPLSPEPKGPRPMFAPGSWERPDHGAPAPASPARAPLPHCPDKVSRASLTAYLGSKRLAEWQAAATGAGVDLEPLFRPAWEFANNGSAAPGLDRHRIAKSTLRTLLCDALRAARATSSTPDAPIAVLY